MGVVISFWVENQSKTKQEPQLLLFFATLFCLLTNLNLLLVLNKAFYFGNCSALTFKNLYSILCSFLFFLESHFAKRFVRLLHKLHENVKGMPFSTAPGAVYRSIDGIGVANQIARLRDSRSLRYANPDYPILTEENNSTGREIYNIAPGENKHPVSLTVEGLQKTQNIFFLRRLL